MKKQAAPRLFAPAKVTRPKLRNVQGVLRSLYRFEVVEGAAAVFLWHVCLCEKKVSPLLICLGFLGLPTDTAEAIGRELEPVHLHALRFERASAAMTSHAKGDSWRILQSVARTSV